MKNGEIVIDEASPTLAQLALAALDQVPMVWTKIGNVPSRELEYSTSWELQTDGDSLAGMVFAEEYRFNGEIVRRDVHIYKHSGVAAESAIASAGDVSA